MRAVGVCSEIALPIGKEPWGLLALYSDQAQRGDSEEAELLQRLADDIDHAAEFIRKSERLEYLAFHNAVTDLPNRARFRERLPELLGDAGRLVVADFDAWRTGTEAYVKEHNEMVKNAPPPDNSK